MKVNDQLEVIRAYALLATQDWSDDLNDITGKQFYTVKKQMQKFQKTAKWSKTVLDHVIWSLPQVVAMRYNIRAAQVVDHIFAKDLLREMQWYDTVDTLKETA